MRTRNGLLLSALVLGGCTHYQYQTPALEVSVELSKAAKAKLSSLHESVRVIAYFDGDSKSGPSEANAPFRAVYIGSTDATAEPGKIARLAHVPFGARQRKSLVDDKYYVLLNVVSGRRSVPNNLLDCSDGEFPVSVEHPALPEPINVRCTLIGEAPGVE